MLYLPEAAIDVIKIFSLGISSFLIAFLFTPLLTKFLYKYQLWRKEVRTQAIDGKDLTYFQKFHSQGETHIPRFGGLLIWMVPAFLALLLYIMAKIDNGTWWIHKLNFLDRGQTWLPFFALGTAALVGLLDDFLQVMGRGKYIAKGLTLKQRIILMGFIGTIGAWWFYSKLGWSSIHVPGMGDFEIGIWYLPLFIVVMMATYSGGVIDGLDGLAGGAFAAIFGAFAGIALFLGQINIAAFCATILGTLFAFLWFNIPPARFYMTETGVLGLTSTMTVVAFLTDSIVVLPIIAGLLVLETGSVIIQLLSKKFRKKKIWQSTPIHHHLEAIGWTPCQITMRFWLIGIVLASLGTAIKLLG